MVRAHHVCVRHYYNAKTDCRAANSNIFQTAKTGTTTGGPAPRETPAEKLSPMSRSPVVKYKLTTKADGQRHAQAARRPFFAASNDTTDGTASARGRVPQGAKHTPRRSPTAGRRGIPSPERGLPAFRPRQAPVPFLLENDPTPQPRRVVPVMGKGSRACSPCGAPTGSGTAAGARVKPQSAAGAKQGQRIPPRRNGPQIARQRPQRAHDAYRAAKPDEGATASVYRA